MNLVRTAGATLLGPLVAAALAGGAGYLGGHHRGQAAGELAERARHDAQALADLKALIDAHRTLIAQTGAASQAMRQALARRAQLDAQTTKEFKDALAATADHRAGCVFSADLMRQLTEARDRAAQAAAGGIRGAVPSPTGADGPQR